MSNPNAKGRPRLQKGKDAVRVSITLPPKLLARLKKTGLPISEVIRAAINSYLGYGD